MRAIDIIIKKREGIQLTKEELNFLIKGYVKNEIPDYQISAFAMACFFKKLTKQEIFDLTDVYINSGIKINPIKNKDTFVVDKHSTGGVGDKTTLVLGPLISSFGISIAKMSGRGLGYTGGTLDKLESIPNFNVNLTHDQFLEQVNKLNFAVMGQTEEVVPADKKIYALRDVTGTTDIMGLIAPSIMSKKLAINSDLIVLDVKCGNGAFMRDIQQAKELSNLMIEIAKNKKRKIAIVISNMSEPLGKAIGNTIEVVEAIDTLQGKGPKDFTELIYEISSLILIEAKKAKNKKEAFSLIENQINSGQAYNQFEKFVKAQNGNLSKLIFNPKYKHEIKSKENGYLQLISAIIFGEVSMELGAGRLRYIDKIDNNAGIFLSKKTGDEVQINDILFTLYSNRPIKSELISKVENAYKISKNVIISKVIYKILK